MASLEDKNNQNVVVRVAHLPLVFSTYEMVSNAYSSTKDNHPYLKSVCEMAEIGVKSITLAAFNNALPLIGKLESPLSMANNLACKGLDTIEKTLPILNKPSDEIVATAKKGVTGAKDALNETMNEAKVSVSSTLTGVIDRTRGAVQGSVELSKSVVSSSVQTVKKSRVVGLVSSGVDTALSTSENLLEQYLPGTQEEKSLENKDDAVSYSVRLGSLSINVRKRAYQKAVAKVRNAVQNSQESLSQLNHNMDLVEFTRKNVGSASLTLHEMLGSLLGRKTSSENETENIESRTLTIANNLSKQLQSTYLVLVSSLKGLPQHVQVQILSVSHSAIEIFSKAAVLGDRSDSVLNISQLQLSRLRDSADNVMDYLVNNTPLNWLVGPFYPRIDSGSLSGSKLKNSRTTEMLSLDVV